MSEYIAGACNIGPAEVKRRQQGAIFGALLFIAVALLFISTDASKITRLITFIPAMLFAVGYIQSRRKFCVAFGFLGVFNFEKTGSTRKITMNQDLITDRKYAVKLLFQSLLIAVALTAIVVFI